MKISIILLLVSFFCSLASPVYPQTPMTNSRIIVLTDMLNEPDDSQVMVHLLMYANKVDIEGLIAVSSCHQYLGKQDKIPARNGVHPEVIRTMIGSYAQVRSNLMRHESGWPEAATLLSKVAAGPAGYGMTAVGVGKSTTGSELIIKAIRKNDPRPLYICINAGANCLAQALIDLRARVPARAFNRYISRLRIYDESGQDNAGAWIAHTFPDLWYQRSGGQIFYFMNEQGPVTWDSSLYPGKGQHDWAKANIQTNHGPLGALYLTRMKWLDSTTYHTLEGGGTSTWIGHVNKGLYDPAHINWGGWGGRFSTVERLNPTAENQLRWAGLETTEQEYKPFSMYPEAIDTWTDPKTGIPYQDKGTAIYRWRYAYQNDFEARMDWCIKPYTAANHNPVAALNHDLSDTIVVKQVPAGRPFLLDATASTDPDNDSLQYYWSVYPEAGTYAGTLTINEDRRSRTSLFIPADAAGKQIHVILEVSDRSKIIPLYDYRRIVLLVQQGQMALPD